MSLLEGSDVIELALDEALCDYAQTEEGQEQVNDTAVTVGGIAVTLLYDVDLLACLVHPEPHIDTASHEGEDEYETARGILGTTAGGVELVDEADEPINAVDAAGDNGKNDGDGYVTLFDGNTVSAGCSVALLLIVLLLITALGRRGERRYRLLHSVQHRRWCRTWNCLRSDYRNEDNTFLFFSFIQLRAFCMHFGSVYHDTIPHVKAIFDIV